MSVVTVGMVPLLTGILKLNQNHQYMYNYNIIGRKSFAYQIALAFADCIISVPPPLYKVALFT